MNSMEAIDKLLAAENKVVSSIQKQFRRAHIFVHDLLQYQVGLGDACTRNDRYSGKGLESVVVQNSTFW